MLVVATDKIYIYVIYFPTSDRLNPYYVGQTDNLKRRMSKHLKSGSLVCRALWKYDDWQITILHTCKTRDDANRIEIEEIRHYNCVALNGYNLTRGGSDSNGFEGHHHTKEAKEKISNANEGNQATKGYKYPPEIRKKFGQPGNQYAKGKHWSLSEKTKEKMRGNQNAKGHKHSKETIEKIKAHIHSDATREKMRQSHQGSKQSKKTVLKRSITQLINRIAKLELEND